MNFANKISIKSLSSESAGSSVKIFTYAQTAMVLLFAFVIVFTLSRFIQVKEIFTYLSDHSVPSIAKASAINSSIQQLATLTVKLANSQSNTDASLTEQQFAQVAEQLINTIEGNTQQADFFAKELSTIIVESAELKSLVEKQLAQRQYLQNSKNNAYTAIFSLTTSQIVSKEGIAINAILQRVLSLAVSIESQLHLHKLRETERELLLRFTQLNKEVSGSQLNVLRQLDSIEAQLVGADGIISQKISLLRTQAKSRGRSSFVVHLIENLASNLQYQTQLVNKATQKRAETGIKMLTNSYEVSVVSSVFAVFASAFTIYYLYRRIVARLIRLSREVETKTTVSEGQVAIRNITVEGNDEITHLSKVFRQYIDKVRAHESYLRQLSIQDSLTLIPNRRAFDEHMAEIFSQAKSTQTTLSLMLIDIDYFKQFNDKYGHASGDGCLQTVATEISQIAKSHDDFCARYGGEEFAYVAANKSPKEAETISESLRFAIKALAVEHKASEVSNVVTVSLGCASVRVQEQNDLTLNGLFELADQQLYKAKSKGRNRCCCTVVS